MDDEGRNVKKPAAKKGAQGPLEASPVHWPHNDDDDHDGGLDATPYCICQKASFGEMIGCDNDDCEIEWVSLTTLCLLGILELMIQFHLSCLGLDTIPGGDWTCPQCTEKMKKNPSKKKAAKPKSRK
jgi:inhibitor of growth protein 3